MAAWRDKLALYAYVCAYCRTKPYTHIDHFHPRRLGGGDELANLVPACAGCNLSKGGKHPRTWLLEAFGPTHWMLAIP